MARRGELKHLSTPRNRKIIDSVSSGERKRNSLNLSDVKLQGVVIRVLWGSTVGILKSDEKKSHLTLTEQPGKVGPRR